MVIRVNDLGDDELYSVASDAESILRRMFLKQTNFKSCAHKQHTSSTQAALQHVRRIVGVPLPRAGTFRAHIALQHSRIAVVLTCDRRLSGSASPTVPSSAAVKVADLKLLKSPNRRRRAILVIFAATRWWRTSLAADIVQIIRRFASVNFRSRVQSPRGDTILHPQLHKTSPDRTLPRLASHTY